MQTNKNILNNGFNINNYFVYVSTSKYISLGVTSTMASN